MTMLDKDGKRIVFKKDKTPEPKIVKKAKTKKAKPIKE